MTDEPMVERLTDEELAELEAIIRPAAEEAEHGTVGECWCETTLADIAPALLLALSQLREQRDRTSFWETLHDERVESLEAERDKALRMRDYWYAEFKRTVDPVNNPHRCSSECAENPTCPVILAYDQDATDAGYQLCDCGHFHRPRTDCGNWWFYPDVLTGRACGCTEWRKPR